MKPSCHLVAACISMSLDFPSRDAAVSPSPRITNAECSFRMSFRVISSIRIITMSSNTSESATRLVSS